MYQRIHLDHVREEHLLAATWWLLTRYVLRLLEYVLRRLVIVRGSFEHSLLQHADCLACDVRLGLLEDVSALLRTRHLQVLVLGDAGHRVRVLHGDELSDGPALAPCFALVRVRVEAFLAVSLSAL